MEVPVVLGKNGIESIVEIQLNEAEKTPFWGFFMPCIQSILKSFYWIRDVFFDFIKITRIFKYVNFLQRQSKVEIDTTIFRY